MADDIECNQIIHRDVEIPNCQETNPGDCHRRYYFLLPNILCQSLRDIRESDSAGIRGEDGAHYGGMNIKGGGSDDVVVPEGGRLRDLDRVEVNMTNSLREVGTLPMVFAVHCLGCDPMTMSNFLPYANSRNLIVVLPEGLHNSFNAKYCCGYALQNGIDDFHFFSLIQSEMSREFEFVNPNVSYAVGWSNGGYMVTHAASLFRAVSPISGYSYSMDSPMGQFGGDWEVDVDAGGRGKGIFLHHSLNDQFVQSTGCCHDPTMPRCCCNIAADACLGVVQAMNNWAVEVNRCQVENGAEMNNATALTATTRVETEISFSDDDRGITCMTATGESCVANTSLCLYDRSGHFNMPAFGKAFPMADTVMDFFARDACEINNGKWDESAQLCECNNYKTYGGVYCLDLIPAESKSLPRDEIRSKTDQVDTGEWIESERKTKSELAVCLVTLIAFTVLFALFLRKRRRILKQNGSKKDESEFEETQELVATRRISDRM